MLNFIQNTKKDTIIFKRENRSVFFIIYNEN